jgi:hypothetical protein
VTGLALLLAFVAGAAGYALGRESRASRVTPREGILADTLVRVGVRPLGRTLDRESIIAWADDRLATGKRLDDWDRGGA